mgnify:CR=1 FL=1|jgi:hypothetical protein
MITWRVRPSSELVSQEIQEIFKDSNIKGICQSALRLLQQEADPANPINSDLNVKHLEHDAPNWYRLRLNNINIRIVFSLNYVREETQSLAEYAYGELPFENAENYILIHFIAYRSGSTYIDVRSRWKRTR